MGRVCPATVKFKGCPFNKGNSSTIFAQKFYKEPTFSENELTLALEGFGYRWFRIDANREMTFYKP